MRTKRKRRGQSRRAFLQGGWAGLMGLAALHGCGGAGGASPFGEGGRGASGHGGSGHGGEGGDGLGGSGTGGDGHTGGSGQGGQGGHGGGLGPRVVQIHGPGVTSWDFQTGHYFDFVDQERTNAMVDAGIAALTAEQTAAAGWQKLLAGYQQGDVVAVKINTNDINWGVEYIVGLPEVINAVIRGLKSAGVPESAIRIYDARRPDNGGIPVRYLDKTGALYPNVVYRGPSEATFSGDHPGQDVSADGWSGRICDLLCEAQHLIAIPLLKAIRRDWGNTGALKLHHGSINTPGGTHVHLTNTSPATNPVAAINGSPHVRDKLRLVVADGLFGMFSGRHFNGQNETDDVPEPWASFGDAATDSLLFSTDPVAIDSVMFDLIEIERAARGLPAMDHPLLDACSAAGLGVQEHSSTLAYTQIDFSKIAI